MPEEFFELGQSIGTWVKSNIRSIEAEEEQEYAYLLTQFFFFCKSYKSYQAIHLLWSNGFDEDAAILTRSLFEIVLQAKYINGDPRARTQSYLEFDIMDRMRTYERVKKSGDEELISILERDAKALSHLKAQCKLIKASYKGTTWWGKSIHSLAREVDLENQYNMMHWIQAGLTHSSSTSMNNYISESHDGLHVGCDPDDNRPLELAVQATWALLIIVGQLSIALGAPDENHLDEWHRRFIQLSKQGGDLAT